MKSSKKNIYVTRTTLPSIKIYTRYLREIWKNNWITNHGPLTLKLEHNLKEYLGVKHLFYVNNGTVALEIAIKALGLSKEIITTPFSYVATTSSIVWTNCKPVYVDIDNKSLCINPELIEKAITKRTQAILATHVYGNPCNVEKIKALSKKYDLKIIYDASHCFGVKYKNKSILNYGDISTISFHATKLFHTAEGGALITNDDSLAHKVSYMRNFGHNGQEDFFGLGINGKNSELHAAIGLSLLPDVNKDIEKRKTISSEYDRLLKPANFQKPEIDKNVVYNYSYYPIIFDSESQLLKVRNALNKHKIYPRRYFYPSLNKLNYVGKFHVKKTEDISKRILCLPLYSGLKLSEIRKITNIIINNT